MTLHRQIHNAPITDRSDVFRLRALFCERQAREYWTSKQDWEVLAIECHTMAHLAARMSGEISQIDVPTCRLALAQPLTCPPRRPVAASCAVMAADSPSDTRFD